MYVTGDFLLSSSSIVNDNRVPSDLIVMVSGTGEVIINSSVEFYGVIYAPDTDVLVDSSVTFYGVVFADSVTFNSSAGFHLDEALEEVALLSDLGIYPPDSRILLVQ